MPRVAIIHSAFHPKLNYMESIAARTLHRLGCEVRVFTSKVKATFESVDWARIDGEYGFKISRYPALLHLRSTVIPRASRVAEDIRNFNPEVALLFAPHQGPGALWMKHLPESCRVVAGFGDLQWHRRSSVAWHLFKKRWMLRCIRRAESVLGITEETCTFLRERFGREVEGKLSMPGLCYDDALYEGSVTEPLPEVAELSKRVRRYFTIVTRTDPGKAIGPLLASIIEVLKRHPDVGFVLAGCTNDECGQALAAQLGESPVAERCLTLPLLDPPKVKALVDHAAFTIWPLVSIGIQQSMACGCPSLVLQGMPVGHFFREGLNGFFYEGPADLGPVAERTLAHPWDASAVRASVAPFASTNLFRGLVEGLGFHLEGETKRPA